jgi:hypothetical protein
MEKTVAIIASKTLIMELINSNQPELSILTFNIRNIATGIMEQ